MSRIQRSMDDSGSVSVFIFGCFVLALLLVATTTDLAVLQLDRRTLQAQADGAALAAAQAPDLAAIYSSGLSTYVPIDAPLARRRALTLLQARSARLAGFRVEAVTTDGRTVFVHLSARIKPPFLRLFGTSIRVDAQARATTAVG
jgi:hypothetical protein